MKPRVARHELPWENGIRKSSTPRGLRLPPTGKAATPLGLRGISTATQGSSCLATLGFNAESLWDSTIDWPNIGAATMELGMQEFSSNAAWLSLSFGRGLG